MTVTSLHGDNTQILASLAHRSAQCVVTSPPYYGLRDYGLPPTEWPEVTYAPMAGLDPITIPAMACCLGLESTPAAYIGHLVYTWRLVRHVLRDDGTVWLNLGDSYAANNSGNNGYRDGRTNRDKRGAAGVPMDLKPKDLLGIPWRAAFALQADGWYLRSDIIWAKPNPMPESVTDRPTKAHEYLFLLAKHERYYYDQAAIAEPAAQSTQDRAHLGKRALSDRQLAMQAQGMHQQSDTLRVYDRPTRNRRTVWTVSIQGIKDAHFATFPEGLVKPCILAGSRPGDTVLDPFAGSGTTMRVAERLQRNSVGIDLNADYIELQQRRTDSVQVELFV